MSHENDKLLQKIIEDPEEIFDDFMKRESANLIYQDKFEQEIRQYEECNKKGDYTGAFHHYDFAHSINEYHISRISTYKIKHY